METNESIGNKRERTYCLDGVDGFRLDGYRVPYFIPIRPGVPSRDLHVQHAKHKHHALVSGQGGVAVRVGRGGWGWVGWGWGGVGWCCGWGGEGGGMGVGRDGGGRGGLVLWMGWGWVGGGG